MAFRPLPILLLASLLYWISGGALYLHERIEHSEEHVAAATKASVTGSCAEDHSAPHRKHPGRDDCPTCQLLAQMQAKTEIAPPPAAMDLLRWPVVELGRFASRPAIVASFAPIRGPPSLSHAA